MTFFATETNFPKLLSDEEASDFERSFPRFLAQFAKSGGQWFFIAFDRSGRYLQPGGWVIRMFEYKKPIVIIDHEDRYLRD